MRRSYQRYSLGLKLGHCGIETVSFQAEVEARHRAIRMVRKFQHSVSKLKVGYARPSRYRMLEIVFEPKMAFIEGDGSVKVPDMKSNMVNSLVHRRSPSVLRPHGWVTCHLAVAVI